MLNICILESESLRAHSVHIKEETGLFLDLVTIKSRIWLKYCFISPSFKKKIPSFSLVLSKQWDEYSTSHHFCNSKHYSSEGPVFLCWTSNHRLWSFQSVQHRKGQRHELTSARSARVWRHELLVIPAPRLLVPVNRNLAKGHWQVILRPRTLQNRWGK